MSEIDTEITVHETSQSEKDEIGQYSKAANELKNIPLGMIRASEVALRSVQEETDEFQLLIESIEDKGVLNAIVVRRQRDSVTGAEFYALIDGLHRFTASGRAGLSEIPAQIVDMDDADVLEAQIIGNNNRIQTKRAEYAKHLLRLLLMNPEWTLHQLARKVHMAKQSLENLLSLNKLHKDIQKHVDDGDLNTNNAYCLAKLPEEHQLEMLDKALTLSPKEFTPMVKDLRRQIKEAESKGKDVTTVEWKPVPWLRKVGEIKAEIESDEFENIRRLLDTHPCNSALEGAQLAIKWVMNFDPDSIEAQRKKHEITEKEKAEKAEIRKAEREAKKAEERKRKTEEVKADLTQGF